MDDAAVSSQGYLYPGDPRVITPSRSSSLRRTSPMTDLDEEFASALRCAHESRSGLGSGLGLAGDMSSSGGSLAMVSSSPRLGGRVYMSPPPSASGTGGSDRKSGSSGSEVSNTLSDDHPFAARCQTSSTSSFYLQSFAHRFTDTTDTRTTTDWDCDRACHPTTRYVVHIVVLRNRLYADYDHSYTTVLIRILYGRGLPVPSSTAEAMTRVALLHQ